MNFTSARSPLRRVFQGGRARTEGSLLFAINSALDQLVEGNPNDEEIAFSANKLVRRYLDKRAITYRDYKEWRKWNKLIFTAIVDQDGTIIGFFDIFPLTKAAGESMVAGELTERTLNIHHILPYEAIKDVTHIHIATVLTNPRQRTFSEVVANECLLLKMGEFITREYAPVEARTFTAFGQSKAGETLLKRCGFTVAVVPTENDQHWALYALPAGEKTTAIFRFGRAGERFALRQDQIDLKDLDDRLHGIELQLRIVIASALDGDRARLPSEVNDGIDGNISRAAGKNAAFDSKKYQDDLLQRLEYSDLSHIKSTISNKLLWALFQSRFLNKETFGAKFDQMSRLRNEIRHGRTVDPIILREGEAGILWFERVLQKPLTMTTAA
jgi:hypothetical protein